MWLTTWRRAWLRGELIFCQSKDLATQTRNSLTPENRKARSATHAAYCQIRRLTARHSLTSGSDPVEKYLFITATLFLTVFGQLIIKARALSIGHPTGGKIGYLLAMLSDPWVWMGLAGAVMASLFWILTLQQLSVSVAYPFVALSFLIVPVGALLFFGEQISVVQWLGFSLIVVGVGMSALGR